MIYNNTLGEIERIISELYRLNKDIAEKLSTCKDRIHQLKTICENESKECYFYRKDLKSDFDGCSVAVRHQADYLSAFLNDTARLLPDIEAIADNLKNVGETIGNDHPPVQPPFRLLN